MNSFNSLRVKENWKTVQRMNHKNRYKFELEIFGQMEIIIVLSHNGDHFHEEKLKNTVTRHLCN